MKTRITLADTSVLIKMNNNTHVLLFILDGELEALQRVYVPRLRTLGVRVEVEHGVELARGARVVQQRRAKILHLLAHLLHTQQSGLERRGDCIGLSGPSQFI